MSSTNADYLKREMESHAHAVLHAQSAANTQLTGSQLASSELRELLRNATHPVGTAHSLFGCLRVELHGFVLTGCLDLRDLGSEANPLPSLTLVDCELQGGMDWSNSYGRGLIVENCAGFPFPCNATPKPADQRQSPAEPNGSLFATGAHFANSVEIEGWAASVGAIFDFSSATIGGECLITDVGFAVPATAGSQVTWPDHPLHQFRLRSTQILGEAKLKGVRVHHEKDSLEGEELHVKGDLTFEQSGVNGCEFHGRVSLPNANITGQLIFGGVHFEPPRKNNRMEGAAVFLESITVGNDLFFTTGSGPCLLGGALLMASARIGGDLQLCGEFQPGEDGIAISARAIEVSGSLWLGNKGIGQDSCTVTGQTNLQMATIKGEVRAFHAVHRADPTRQPPVPIKSALSLPLTHVSGDLVLHCCQIEGLTLTGTTVGGRWIVEGSTITAMPERKAINANGAILRGGFLFRPAYIQPPALTTVTGDIRLRNATVDGPALLTGVTLIAKPGGSGVALWANNCSFKSDFVLSASGDEPSRVQGELRLSGSTIGGSLRIEGTHLRDVGTGCAIECISADVRQEIFIGQAATDGHRPTTHKHEAPERTRDVATEIVGVVNLDFARAAAFTFGSEPPYELPGTASKPYAVALQGVLMMRNAQIKGTVILADASLRPEPGGGITSYMKAHTVYRANTVVHAVYAALGNRLWVRLDEKSRGLINLFGSTTGTIGAWSGELRENWGKFPELHGGRSKMTGDEQDECVLLNLGQFTYKFLNDVPEGKEPDAIRLSGSRIFWYTLGCRPMRKDLQPRYDWLARQIKLPTLFEERVSSPWRQIAKTYREMGQMRISNEYSVERRWRETLTKGHWFHLMFNTCFVSVRCAPFG